MGGLLYDVNEMNMRCWFHDVDFRDVLINETSTSFEATFLVFKESIFRVAAFIRVI